MFPSKPHNVLRKPNERCLRRWMNVGFSLTNEGAHLRSPPHIPRTPTMLASTRSPQKLNPRRDFVPEWALGRHRGGRAALVCGD